MIPIYKDHYGTERYGYSVPWVSPFTWSFLDVRHSIRATI
ncbi:hypothetical protein RSAG8_06648, partial [Rhizoctonia solani AG-8 WAC10335]